MLENRQLLLKKGEGRKNGKREREKERKKEKGRSRETKSIFSILFY